MALSKHSLNRIIGLKQEHSIVCSFAWSSSHKQHMCMMKNMHTGAVVHTGTSPASEEAAFRDAADTINIEAINAPPGTLAEENSDLRKKLRDLESKMENTPAEVSASSSSDDGVASEGTRTKKKVRRRRRSSSDD